MGPGAPLSPADPDRPDDPDKHQMQPARRRVLGAGLAGAGGWGLGPGLGLGVLAGCSDGGRPPPPSLATLPAGGWWGDAMARGHRVRDAVAALAAGSAPASPSGSVPGSARAAAAAGSSDTPQRRCDVAIIGAGIAGLAAARALRAAGIEDLRVFELDDAAGGNARHDTLGGMPCPTAAHYLPVPQPPAHEVIDWLHEIGLLRQHLGRTVPDERHLCHSPQERLWLHGPWREGLLPPAEPGSARQAQYRGFARAVAEAQRDLGFAQPSRRAPWTAGHAVLDGQTFDAWLTARGLTDPALRWYLDYACRDDYGADARTVSAWAGLHYFASRHGFHAPGDDEGEREAVFTWPEGNAWLVRHLAAPLGDRLLPDRAAVRVEPGRHGVTIDLLVFDPATTGSAGTAGSSAQPGAGARSASAGPTAPPRTERWHARQVVLAVPLHVAARIVAQPPEPLREAAARVQHAPWLVANLQLAEPLTDKPGAAPAWDNVLLPAGVLEGDQHAAWRNEERAEGRTERLSARRSERLTAGHADDGSAASAASAPRAASGPAAAGLHGAALGYVDAMHQSWRPVPGPTVLTSYWALGDGSPADRQARRAALAGADWRPWALQVLAELARAHPDLPAKTVAIRLARHGHAMAIPVPGFRGLPALGVLRAGPLAAAGRVRLAHADLAGCSVFEEAFTAGHEAGLQAAQALRQARG